MAEYRIVCTTQEPPQVPNDRAHIVAVGTGRPPILDVTGPIKPALT
jgi:hypothetical protein